MSSRARRTLMGGAWLAAGILPAAIPTHSIPRGHVVVDGARQARQAEAVATTIAVRRSTTLEALPARRPPTRGHGPTRARGPLAHAAATAGVVIRDFSFGPASITVHAGDTVSWSNEGPSPHTATGQGFDTGTLSNGQSASHTFSTSGSFSYTCTIHPFMKATVVVLGSGTATAGATASSSAKSVSQPRSSGSATPTSAATSPQLPRTGFDSTAAILIGLLTAATGVVLRRASRPPRRI